jgi:hypothetical protein
MSMAATGDKAFEDVVMRRAFWGLTPFLLAAYLIVYIDRVNVRFAAL